MTGSSGYGTSSESSRQPRFSTPGLSGSDEHGLSANLPSMLSSSSPSKDLVLESPETQTHVRPLSGNKAQGGAFGEHGAQIGELAPRGASKQLTAVRNKHEPGEPKLTQPKTKESNFRLFLGSLTVLHRLDQNRKFSSQ